MIDSASPAESTANRSKAVVLLSGGIDSTTTLAVAREDGYQLHAITFDYGQRHRLELTAAAKVAQAIGVEQHLIVKVDLSAIGGSALTADIDVPKHPPGSAGRTAIPVTYVPARNTVFLSLALAWAETLDATTIFIGANAVDYSGYPDCRPEFIEAFQRLANLATKAAVEGKKIAVKAPLIALSKAEIIKTGIRLGVDYSLTSSCYDPDPQGLACGACDSCLIRRKGFRDAGVPDPTRYASPPEK